MRHFFRLSGGGNDFLALAEPIDDPTPEQIRAWCRRGLSLGADGLFLLNRSPDGARMRHFNADGGAAELCLNGTRCAVRLARHLGWSDKEIVIETGAGLIPGSSLEITSVTLALERPGEPQPLEVEVEGEPIEGFEVPVGVPHFVIPWPDGVARAPVASLGRRLRSAPAFGDAGTNVDFAHFVERHRMEIRTYERGVENETLACGTGVMASVAVGVALGELELPVTVLTRGGFHFEVGSWISSQGEARWGLKGDARLLAEGEIVEGAEDLPEPPQWR
jgi:diaminopimelate epimerase